VRKAHQKFIFFVDIYSWTHFREGFAVRSINSIMSNPSQLSGSFDAVTCHTLNNDNNGFRINDLSKVWTQGHNISSRNQIRATRNVGGHQFLLDILDEALEITALPIPSAINWMDPLVLVDLNSVTRTSQQVSDNDANHDTTSVSGADMFPSGSVNAMSMQQRRHCIGLQDNLRMTDEKQPEMDRQ
jgi:hypothetical protein